MPAAEEDVINELEWVRMTAGAVDGEQNHGERVKNKFMQNPFIPIGLIGTTAFLICGLRAMKRGDSMGSQMMMRGRILAQGATVLAMIGGFMIEGAADAKRRREAYETAGK